MEETTAFINDKTTTATQKRTQGISTIWFEKHPHKTFITQQRIHRDFGLTSNVFFRRILRQWQSITANPIGICTFTSGLDTSITWLSQGFKDFQGQYSDHHIARFRWLGNEMRNFSTGRESACLRLCHWKVRSFFFLLFFCLGYCCKDHGDVVVNGDTPKMRRRERLLPYNSFIGCH